jgi:hypothetical protein
MRPPEANKRNQETQRKMEFFTSALLFFHHLDPDGAMNLTGLVKFFGIRKFTTPQYDRDDYYSS